MNKFVDIKKETECREEFKRILFDLSKSQEVLQSPSERANIYLRLEKLYHNSEFRHYYSDIFSVLTSVQQDCNLGDINILGQNLEIIIRGYHPKNTDDNGNTVDISNQLKKLYDHVSLDIARITYSDAADYRLLQNESINDIKAEVSDLQKGINDLQKRLDKSANKIKSAYKKVENAQKEYIAILGIFASIILTFISGIVFTTSILQNIHNASIYRIVLITLLIGLIVLNAVYLLFYFIERIVKNHKKIENKTKNTNERRWFIYVLNSIILLLVVLTVLSWKLGIVENRNKEINNTSVIQETIPEEITGIKTILSE